MPRITREIADLTPNTFDPNNSNSQSTWFSYVRTVYSRERGGTILPPTKTEFMREWNSYDPNFVFTVEADTLEECKRALSFNCFPRISYIGRLSGSRLTTRNKAIAWTRMIMAFNMYADVKREFGVLQNNHIDFIGSKRNDTIIEHTWDTAFHRRCILFISNDKLQQLLELSNYCTNSSIDNEQFWSYIFEIYDNLPTNRRFRVRIDRNNNNNIAISPPAPAPTPAVSSVDNPTHTIAQEYMSRDTEENEEDVPSNHEIAEMIANAENLPSELRKEIYETCMAFHISHPL